MSKKYSLSKVDVIQDAMKDLKITEEPIETYYTFGDDIGAGKYGIVKMGISVNNQDFKVAIKVIDLAKLTGNFQSCVSEIATLKKVDHPNIVKIYEIFKDDKNLYIVMEYVDGKELFEYVVEKKTKVNELDSANITKQLLKTVKYLNSMNICHRDIKPENILINPKSKQVKLIDFGLAIEYSEFNQLTEKVGTPYYVSPEVLKGNYNKQCDMWSVGVITYILLTGCPPFQGENLAEVYNEILYEKLKLYRSDWENLSSYALEFVKHMLKKSPEIRMTPDQALAHQFILQRKTNSTIKTSVLKKLLKNKPSDFLKKEIFMILSTYFKNDVIEKWNKCFHNLDKEGTGLIKVSELVKMMRDANLNASSISKIEEEYGGSDDPSISYSDFMTKVINFKREIKEEDIEKAFKQLDVDKSGRIGAEDLHSLIQRRGHDHLTPSEFFSEIDKAKSMNLTELESSEDLVNASSQRQDISLGTFKQYILGDGEMSECSEFTVRSSFINCNGTNEYETDYPSRENLHDLGSILIPSHNQTGYEEEKHN